MPSLPHLLISRQEDGTVASHKPNPVVAFIIGLSIVTLASILNAAGLNLTKLDHVRTSAIPKSARRRDWLRPLWLLGMILYILSQLLGSTLALRYMRAEYVAPLGSTSLIFNFLFARFLIGTPVTMTDVYGTVVIIVGVVGIVAFGSINTGLSTETSAEHLATLWSRGGWIAYFIVMSLSLTALYIFASQLELVLNSRSDLSAQPFAGMSGRMTIPSTGGFFSKLMAWKRWAMVWLAELLESWTATKDDKVIAWTLGIGWACAGGGMAGECLVFAKAAVQVISGAVTHENPGNQIGHFAPIVTFIFLATTAVAQIICLNRGLKVYDSTLVVPVFYGVYTATGWLNSLIFTNATDAFASWTLFLIFASILVLISGVVLLTHKKPENPAAQQGIPLSAAPTSARKAEPKDGVESERAGLRGDAPTEVVWDVGNASDDEDEHEGEAGEATPRAEPSRVQVHAGEEGVSLMGKAADDDEDDAPVVPPGLSPSRTLPTRRRSASNTTKGSDDEDEYGAFKDAR
ncbi:hypothetical protein PENSPDRAFT_753281 [Peniophora sp. CONT]|nr:hypothetical protein PENSPDRAFT_753281 [Peniophora sp. CONT]